MKGTDRMQSNLFISWAKPIYGTFQELLNLASVRFLATLEETNWSSLEGYDDPNSAYNSILMKYSETYNACFPLKILAGKRKLINKPWLSKALIKCIKRKNKLYKLYIQNPSTDREIIYKHYKKQIKSLIADSKTKVLREETG